MSSNEWQKLTLGEISKDVSYGYTASAQSEPVGPKFLRITDIVGGLNWDTVPYCEIAAREYKKCKLEIGDIVIARTGATTGITKIIKEDKKAVFASYLIRFRIDETKAAPFFVGHVLKSDNWKEFIKSVVGGSAQPGANATVLSQYEIRLPPITIQHRIADILSALDEKIELNRQTNAILEAITQAIFKEWFVDFNFPGTTGEMVESELGMIPCGWRMGKLGEICEFAYGKGLKSENRAEGEYPVVGSNGIVGTHNEYLVKGPGIVIGRKGTIGEVIWIHKDFFPIDTTFYIKDLLGVGGLYFHYFLLKGQDFKKIASDSAVPGLNRNQAYDNLIVIPTPDAIKRFNAIVLAIFKNITNDEQQSSTIAAIRDVILPKLMNGVIHVGANDYSPLQTPQPPKVSGR